MSKPSNYSELTDEHSKKNEYSVFSNNSANNTSETECTVHEINESNENTMRNPLNQNPYPSFENLHSASNHPENIYTQNTRGNANPNESINININEQHYPGQDSSNNFFPNRDFFSMIIYNIIIINRTHIKPRLGDKILGRDIPILSNLNAIAIFIVNFFAPGVGTMLISCLSTEPINTKLFFVVIGLCQLLAVPLCFLGWLWAMTHSVQIVAKSYEGSNEVTTSV